MLPSQRRQFVPIDCIPTVIERPVARVLDATLKAFFSDTKCCAELFGEVEIFNLVLGVDVVDFANAAFVEDGVEGVGCVARVEIAPRVVAFAVDVERFVTL